MRTELPDGSMVWLNVNSSMTYPMEFKNGCREVELRGEAYFDVDADKDRPFVVKALGVEVVATGTQFNVNAYTHPTVTLVKGAVSVGVSSVGGDFKLVPGDRFDISGDSVMLSHNNDVERWCCWRDGRIIFDDDLMSDVFERLEQIYNVKFTILAPDIVSTRFHASFAGENINDILRLIEYSAPIRFEVKETDEATSCTRIDVLPVG